MARYNGPRLRKVRRIGTELPGLTTKTSAKRPAVPGMHGPTKRMNKTSEFGLRLKEKQKLRLHYGLTERAMRLVFTRAQRMAGDTGRNMLGLLEARFDNLVWRAGLTRTIPSARQLITHGHINLHGKRAKTPSQTLSVGDSFQIREASRNREDLRISANSPVRERPAGIKIDLDTMVVTIEALPGLEQVPLDVNVQKVIEYFAK
jgi:small subunit ribosomal protein S4